MLGTTMVGYSGVVRCDSAPEARGTKWSESLQEGDLVRVEVRALPRRVPQLAGRVVSVGVCRIFAGKVPVAAVAFESATFTCNYRV